MDHATIDSDAHHAAIAKLTAKKTTITTWQANAGIRFATGPNLDSHTHARHFSTHSPLLARPKLFPEPSPASFSKNNASKTQAPFSQPPALADARLQRAPSPSSSSVASAFDNPISARGALQAQLERDRVEIGQLNRSLKETQDRNDRLRLVLKDSESAVKAVKHQLRELQKSHLLELTQHQTQAEKLQNELDTMRRNEEEDREKYMEEHRRRKVFLEKQHAEHFSATKQALAQETEDIQQEKLALDNRWKDHVQKDRKMRAAQREEFRQQVKDAISPYVQDIRDEAESRVALATRGYRARQAARAGYTAWKNELHGKTNNAINATLIAMTFLKNSLERAKWSAKGVSQDITNRIDDYQARLDDNISSIRGRQTATGHTLHASRLALRSVLYPTNASPSHLEQQARRLYEMPLDAHLTRYSVHPDVVKRARLKVSRGALKQVRMGMALLRRVVNLELLRGEPSELQVLEMNVTEDSRLAKLTLMQIRAATTQVRGFNQESKAVLDELRSTNETAAMNKAKQIVMQNILNTWTKEDTTQINNALEDKLDEVLRHVERAAASALPRLRRDLADGSLPSSRRSARGRKRSVDKRVQHRPKFMKLKQSNSSPPPPSLSAPATTNYCPSVSSDVPGYRRWYTSWHDNHATNTRNFKQSVFSRIFPVVLAHIQTWRRPAVPSANHQGLDVPSDADSEWESVLDGHASTLFRHEEGSKDALLCLSGSSSNHEHSKSCLGDDTSNNKDSAACSTGDSSLDNNDSFSCLSENSTDNNDSFLCLSENSTDIVQLDYQIPQDVLANALSADPTSPLGAWTFRLYENSKGESIQVRYHTNVEQAEAAAASLLNEPVLGFDLEWEEYSKAGTHEIKRCVSLIQLASEDRCHIFHVALFKGTTAEDLMPPSLRSLLTSTDCIKAGVNVAGDAGRILRCFGFEMQGVFELSHMYKLVMFGQDNPEKVNKTLVRLADQVQQLLSLPLPKGEVRTSRWSMRLNLEQSDYAASDAYAGFRLFHALDEKRRALKPTPPRPAFWELRLPIELADGNLSTTKRLRKDVATSAEDEDTDEFFDALETQEPEAGSTTMASSGTVDKAEGAKTSTTTRSAAKRSKLGSPEVEEIKRANEWTTSWLDTRPASAHTTLSRAPLRAYHLWHQQGFSLEETAALLREPPLASNTVASYVLDAITKGNLASDDERLRLVMQRLPQTVHSRYRALTSRLGL